MSKWDELVLERLCLARNGSIKLTSVAAVKCTRPCDSCKRDFDAILALLSDPDDRMVGAAAVAVHETDFPLERQRATFDAMPEAYQRRLLINAKAAIRAAMKAVGE